MSVGSAAAANGRERVPLPVAASRRWQLVRSGLLNLFRYDNEEFWFEQGRLLLRGNNGTGKSRVLALQLPFLLDGDTSPHRLEPDGDSAKRIEWNLLMGKYADRLGYTWIEFGRRDDDGTTHYLTLGCGLSATEGRGLVGRWFFITELRIGAGLVLQAPEGYPLTRERLEEALGTRGEVFTTAATYRRAVDRALFHLGEHRYEALVGLLIQLRQPQLSRQLDEKRLSAALTEALRPLAPSVIADVAEAFRSLESDRTTLTTFTAARQGAETFLGEYRRYAQIAARRRAERVRATHAAYEGTMRRLRSAEAALEQANREAGLAADRLDQLTLEERSASTTVDTLRASPQMRSADMLDAARRAAVDKERHVALAHEALERATGARVNRDTEHATAEHALNESQGQFDRDVSNAHARAVAAGAEQEHDAAVNAAFVAEVPGTAHLVRVRRQLDSAVDRRVKASRHVRGLNAALDSARRAYESAKGASTRLSAELDSAIDTHERSRLAFGAATTALIAGLRSWASSLVELRISSIHELAAEVEIWSSAGEGRNPMAVATSTAASATANSLAGLRADADQRRATSSTLLAALRDERERLLAGHHLPPPAPHTRGERVRGGRPGAPLWQLCDFRAEVPADDRAGIEAALEAASLLDAWVMPDGRLLAAGEHDTVLIAASDIQAVPARHLGALLLPAVDRADPMVAAVTDDVVERVLAQIGVGDGTGAVWVDGGGRWCVGPLHGEWAKPAAQHIGESAREARRRLRLAELEREIGDGAQAVSRIDQELAQLAARAAAAKREADAAPDDGAVRSANAAMGVAARHADELRTKVRASEVIVGDTHRTMIFRQEERDRGALDLGVTAWVDDLSQLDDAISDYRSAISDLLNSAERRIERVARRDAARIRADEAQHDELRDRAVLDEARRGAAEAAAERDTLQGSIGADVNEILARLAVAVSEMDRARDAKEHAEQTRTDIRVRIARAESEIASEGSILQRDTAERQVAITALEAFSATRLLPTCDPQLGDIDVGGGTVSRAVEAARRIEAALSRTVADDDAWRRGQEQIHRHVQALTDVLLPHGYEPATEIADGIFVVTASFLGRRCTMAELRTGLDDEITSRQALLNAREREILENHLVGEVAQHLHELLREGERNVQYMNSELRDRPTSTGMTLRFVWLAADDGPAEFPIVRKHLLRAGATWSPADRESLGAFLQRRIQIVRTANETGTWQEHLALALDYRAWHQFTVERQQDGQWKRLTRRTHGTGSGGEKAIALTIPQFAAAAAHYRTAHPLAPRLILLDEAFVGIDADMRSKSMGLLHAFDLDFVMTSEREWGCYATLPGVAIYQLATRPGIDAVGVTRWVWNGRQRVRADHPTPVAVPGTSPDRHSTAAGGNGAQLELPG